MKIIVDAFGGDNAPSEIINASLLALYKHKTLKITLVGKADVIQDHLQGKKYDHARLDIFDARQVIGTDEAPVEAIRTKKDSSIVRAIELLKEKPDEYSAVISAGSTGALLSAAVLKLGRIKGVIRPALTPLLPTAKGTPVMLADAGANMDIKPINILQFAIMANTYMTNVLGIKRPRIALLNVGVEDVKGNEFARECFPLLKQMPINFVGNMEARDFLSGDYDIVLAEGFSGNVLLKSTEGACKMLMKELKNVLMSSFRGKIGGLLIKKPLKQLLKRFDYEGLGGSVLLGTKGLVIKAHGSSKAKQFLSVIDQALEVGNASINKEIEKEIAKLSIERLEQKAQTSSQIENGKKQEQLEKEKQKEVQTEPNTKEFEEELKKETLSQAKEGCIDVSEE